MTTERQREATEARSLGAQQAQEIRARADREATIIRCRSPAQGRRSPRHRRRQRNRIFAEAFNRDPEFFAFYRSMQAYEVGLKAGDTRMVLSPDSPFFRYFNNSRGTGGKSDRAK